MYPAIDVEASISRVMPQIINEEHFEQAQYFKQIYSTYRQNQDLINVGAYAMGSDPKIDEAIAMFPKLQALIQQGMNQSIDWKHSVDNLIETMQISPPVADQTMQMPEIFNPRQNRN